MEILKDVLIILSLNIVILWLFSLLKLPDILGLVMTGFLIGPHGLKIIKDPHNVEIISEIGIILLLFTIGLEFSLKELKEYKRDILILGTLQILLSFVISAFFLFFYPLTTGIFLGMIIGLSSTAVVMKIYQDRNEVHSPYGRISIAILIFQDIVAILYLIALPFVKEIQNAEKLPIYQFHYYTLLVFFTKMLLFIVIFFFLYRYIIPFTLRKIALIRNKDLFVLSIITLCFLIAYLTYEAGLSLAFGAFLAGLLIAETPFSFESMSNVIPFKIVFTSIFFTSIGMMIEIEFLFSLKNLVSVFSIVLFVLAGKFLTVFLLVFLFHKNFRIAFIVGIALFQIGEFSFLLLKEAWELRIIDEYVYQLFLVSSSITMLVTPVMMMSSHRLAYLSYDFLQSAAKKYRWRFVEKVLHDTAGSIKDTLQDPLLGNLDQHIIIVGYGINGRNVAKAAKIMDIPYVIIEMNIKTVEKERGEGEPIFYGDATNEAILQFLQIKKAKLLVIVINDFQSTKRIISLAKRLNPSLYVIARTRFIMEVPKLLEAGADEVIPEEFETSIQIFRRILEHYHYSLPEIQFFTEELRISGYEILRRGMQREEKETE